MNKAIEVLMTEHRLIERVLGSLETYSGAVVDGRELERRVLADYVEFFARFADACHHGKEEEILFRRMAENGFSTDSGPLAVMLYEHTLNRQHVGSLRSVAQGSGAIEAPEREKALAASQAFVPLLRQHILKEDRILYPMALQMLAPPELDAIESDFDSFEREFSAGGAVVKLYRLADDLDKAFPPNPALMAASALTGCGMR